MEPEREKEGGNAFASWMRELDRWINHKQVIVPSCDGKIRWRRCSVQRNYDCSKDRIWSKHRHSDRKSGTRRVERVELSFNYKRTILFWISRLPFLPTPISYSHSTDALLQLQVGMALKKASEREKSHDIYRWRTTRSFSASLPECLFFFDSSVPNHTFIHHRWSPIGWGFSTGESPSLSFSLSLSHSPLSLFSSSRLTGAWRAELIKR